ncbi:hypothetical protein A9264_11095 [Vibrio sp. UCD-FRSSP16_10]|uniref:ATP-binding cassette domain-containing protein n=1 Tax=unclassified Vibrio TaxID=2614977 RepID=UPI0007FE5E42|nr:MULTISPECIES: ATP-binding cassette domain-containing protein [unclassified Vibrio]OBT16806.1 hypothetical protein A9260_11315 [Vibrio sp. UCD-FRSSP16_30]OBT21433.1 hypothetical protein A9264_11095 [Vibrio sp. UCD-FRSSP16_10]
MNKNSEHFDTLKRTSIALLKQVGMNAQARNLTRNPTLERMTPVDLSEQLKKFNITFTVNKAHRNQLEESYHPFIGIRTAEKDSENEYQASLFRHRGKRYEINLVGSNTWEEISFEEIQSFSHIIVLETLPSRQINIRTYLKELNQRRKWYWPVLILTLMSTITGLSIPLFTMTVYDKVIGSHLVMVLPQIAVGAVIALFIYVGARLLRGYILSKTVTEFVREIANITFYRLCYIPLMLLSRVGITNHINRMKNTERVRSILAGTVGGSMLDLPFVVIVLVVIALLAGWLVLVPICMLVLNYIISLLLTKYTNAALPLIYNEHQDAVTELSRNILFLKSGGSASGWITNLHRVNRENARQNFLFAKRNGLFAAVSQFMAMATGLTTIFVGIFLVLNQSITSGALIACVMLIWRITGPASMAFSSSLKFTMIQSAIKQFDGFLSVPTENNELRLDIPNIQQAPKLLFKGVTFRYSAEGSPALSNVESSIENGSIVAVIGPNGCGKSTLLLTALGVIEPQAGFVSVNESNIRQYDPSVFRGWCSYAPAETNLVEGSLAQNIRAVKADATDADILNALIQAGAQPLLDIVGGDINQDLFDACNIMMSSLEVEAIALARVIISDSNFILMDEPISSGNPVVKAAFSKFLDSAKGSKTVIFSTHDQSILEHVDQVIVMDKGTIAYSGPVSG